MNNLANSPTIFREFVRKLRHWTEQIEITPLLDYCCAQCHIDPPATPPTLKTLWYAYLQETLPDHYREAILNGSDVFSSQRRQLTHRLAALSEYTPVQMIRDILQDTVLCFLPSQELDQIIKSVFEFHHQLTPWQDGTWHQIMTQKNNGIDQVTEKLRFQSKWHGARFLNHCGYPLLYSRDSFQAWLKFSGQAVETGAYELWKTLMSSLSLSKTNTLKTERFLDMIFHQTTKLDIPTLCTTKETCAICPLSDKCQYFQSHFSSDSVIQIEKRIRSDQISELSARDILKYLLNQEWENLPHQNTCLDDFPEISVNALQQQYKTPGKEKFILSLLAIQELIRRKYSDSTLKEGAQFSTSQDIFNHYHHKLSQNKQESFHILMLDNKHRILQLNMVTTGILNRSLVHPREVFAPAIQLRAAAIVLIHNHPSGDPQPSQQDFDITGRLSEVGNLMGIKVLDHVIIGKKSYYSFIDEGVMP